MKIQLRWSVLGLCAATTCMVALMVTPSKSQDDPAKKPNPVKPDQDESEPYSPKRPPVRDLTEDVTFPALTPLTETLARQADRSLLAVKTASVTVFTTNENKDKRTPIKFTLFANNRIVANVRVGGGEEWKDPSVRTIDMKLTGPVLVGEVGRLKVEVDGPNCDWNAKFEVRYTTDGGSKATPWTREVRFTHYYRVYDSPEYFW